MTGHLALMFVLFGCQQAPKHDLSREEASASVEAAITKAVANNPADEAAMKTAAMPPVRDSRIRQEILLNVALYRAAHESNVGDFTRHFVLEPVQEENPPNLGVNPEEFRLRVLAELADVGAPVAWVANTWQTRGIDFFPGTKERATRLGIRIISRDDDQATVLAEVMDWTADVGSSRQGVSATWDGLRWNIERDRVRLVW